MQDMDKEQKKKIMQQNHWSNKTPKERKKIREQISRAMEKYHRNRLTKYQVKNNE